MARPKNAVTEYEECTSYRDKLQVLIDIHVQRGDPPAGCATAVDQVGLMTAAIKLIQELGNDHLLPRFMEQSSSGINSGDLAQMPFLVEVMQEVVDGHLLRKFIDLAEAEQESGHLPDWPNTIRQTLILLSHPPRYDLARTIFIKPVWAAEEPIDYDNGVPILAAYERNDRYWVWCSWCADFHIHGPCDGHCGAHCLPDSDSPYRTTGYILRRVGAFGQIARRRGSISLKRRFEIFRRDDYRCRICGASADDGATLEVDHKVPVSAGGGDDDENLWTACYDCNRGKGDSPL